MTSESLIKASQSINPLANTGSYEVNYDDFGLPIRARQSSTPLSDDSDSEEGFKDVAASEAADKGWPAPYGKQEVLEKNEHNVGPENIERRIEAVLEKAENENNGQTVTNEHTNEPRIESQMSKHGEEHDVQGLKQSRLIKEDIGLGLSGLGLSAGPKVDAGKSEETERCVPESLQLSQLAMDSSTLEPVAKHHQSNTLSISEYSHQHFLVKPKKKTQDEDEGEWQDMPSYAPYDMYDDNNKLIAKENVEELADMSGYANVGGAAKGYTRVDMDDDVDSQTSLDDNTAYLFKGKSTALADEDGEVRDAATQMQTTKNLLTEGQRVAYVGLVRLASIEAEQKFSRVQSNKRVQNILDLQRETSKMWSQQIMVRLYEHMEITTSEQIMIEQLSEHGVVPADLTPSLVTTIPIKDFPDTANLYTPSTLSPSSGSMSKKQSLTSPAAFHVDLDQQSLPANGEHSNSDHAEVMSSPHVLSKSKDLDIDLRWTVLCDLFLVLIADSVYDARSRELFQAVGKHLSVDWLEICRFEKRITDALEMQEQADKENWNEDGHMSSRAKRSRNKRLAFMGLATVGGGLVIGLSAGLLAPLIGAGLAAGFTTIGVAGTSSFLAGAGGAALITSTGVVTGGTVGVRAMNRRTGAVKTFEYRPLHNNKRPHLIITLAGWMNGKVDDVRLPYSTVDPIMGDIYSVLWEPEMLRSMGDTINILATEALTQGLQQVLGSTILTALMAAMTLPLALTKLSYLIDNPWIVSQARADMAGLILADSLLDRNLGTRPVTLVGFSLGSRVIFSCLKELAKRKAFGLVQNVYMFGTPAVAKHDEYIKARAIIPGRFVNGYATNDWILGYLFRATSGGVLRVAGLAPIEVPAIENVNVTELVPGHMAYRAAMPKLLREVGWIVESDEFTEIEDPDPENREKRQRELINEIEEARKELEKQAAEKEKKGGKLSWWRRKKAEKKDWEVYDEYSTAPHKSTGRDGNPAKIAEIPTTFDIDAISKEVATLAAKSKEHGDEAEFKVKEIESTLPPMKIDISSSPASSPNPNLAEMNKHNDNPEAAMTPDLRTESPNDTSYTNGRHGRGLGDFDEEHVEMIFDSSFHDSSTPVLSPGTRSSPSVLNTSLEQPSAWQSRNDDSLPSWEPMAKGSASDAANPASNELGALEQSSLHSTHIPLYPTGLNGTTSAYPGHNAWADEFDDDFGREKEVKMTFM